MRVFWVIFKHCGLIKYIKEEPFISCWQVLCMYRKNNTFSLLQYFRAFRLRTNTFWDGYRPPSGPSTRPWGVSSPDVARNAWIVSDLVVPADLDYAVDGLFGIAAFRALCKVDIKQTGGNCQYIRIHTVYIAKDLGWVTMLLENDVSHVNWLIQKTAPWQT